jgi:hypothetical protein
VSSTEPSESSSVTALPSLPFEPELTEGSFGDFDDDFAAADDARLVVDDFFTAA